MSDLTKELAYEQRAIAFRVNTAAWELLLRQAYWETLPWWRKAWWKLRRRLS